MWRIAGILVANLIAFLVAPDAATGAPPGVEQFQVYGEAIQGWWEGNGASAFSEVGLAKAGEVYSGRSSELWILDKAAIECRWQSGTVCGRALRFWDPGAKRIGCLGIASNGTMVKMDITPQGEGWDEKVHITLADGTSFSGSSPRLVSKGGGIHFFEGTNWVSGDKKLPDSWDVWRKVPAPKVPQEAIEAMRRLVGDWEYEGVFGEDAVRGSFTCNWAPAGHCLVAAVSWSAPQFTSFGNELIGWDASRQQLVSRSYWDAGWSNTYRYTLKSDSQWEGDADCPDDTGKAMTARISLEFTGPREYVYRWFDRVDEGGESQPGMTLRFRKVQAPEMAVIPCELLKEYGKVMVGQWEAREIVLAQDLPGVGKKGDKVSGRASCRWILDGAALAWEWQFGGVQGRGLNFWDPAAKQLKGFGVDATGTISHEVVTKEGEKLVARSEAVFPDGKRRKVTDTLTVEEGGATHIHVGSDNIVDGVPQTGYRDVWNRISK